jgi:hypothetical protein
LEAKIKYTSFIASRLSKKYIGVILKLSRAKLTSTTPAWRLRSPNGESAAGQGAGTPRRTERKNTAGQQGRKGETEEGIDDKATQ